MKIGILTWARNINYGGVLQALALRTAIGKLGWNAELIHYEPLQADISYKRLFGLVTHTRLNAFVGACLDVVLNVFINGYFFSNVMRLFRSRRFIVEYICLSKRRYVDYREFCGQCDYDVVVVGSDQVWNPIFFGDSPAYLLKDMPSQVKKISYAASVATSHIGDRLHFFEEALPGYAAISLRERSSIKELQDCVDKKIEWVVDPTLLLSADEWSRILDLPAKKLGKHYTVYWLSDIDVILPRLIELASRNKLHIHLFGNIDSFRVRQLSLKSILNHMKIRLRMLLSRRVVFMKSKDARGFLSDLVTSRGIVSDSFHALMFSTVFKKPVSIITPPERAHMSSRINDFLVKVGFVDITRESLDNAAFTRIESIDGKDVSRLNKWIEDSRAWLALALKM